MQYAFEDRDNLYLVIDLMTGGDLRYHIGKMRKFNEEQTSKSELFHMICRILRCLHDYLLGILAPQPHPPSRHQARKPSV